MIRAASADMMLFFFFHGIVHGKYQCPVIQRIVSLTSSLMTHTLSLQLGKACYPFVAGKGTSVSSLSFLFLFLPCPSLSSLLQFLLSLFSFALGDNTKLHTKANVLLNSNTINQNHGELTYIMLNRLRCHAYF